MQGSFRVAHIETSLRRAVEALRQAESRTEQRACKRNIRALAQRLLAAQLAYVKERLHVLRIEQFREIADGARLEK